MALLLMSANLFFHKETISTVPTLMLTCFPWQVLVPLTNSSKGSLEDCFLVVHPNYFADV
mgnify:CR=1 FL=1